MLDVLRAIVGSEMEVHHLPAVDSTNQATGAVTGPISTPIVEPLSDSQPADDDATQS